MSIIRDKSFQFSIEVIYLSRRLNEKREFILSKQILKSGTAIGALVAESEFAQSKRDFINKLHIALKEANETKYWLSLLCATHMLSEEEYANRSNDCQTLINILVASINTAKKRSL